MPGSGGCRSSSSPNCWLWPPRSQRAGRRPSSATTAASRSSSLRWFPSASRWRSWEQSSGSNTAHTPWQRRQPARAPWWSSLHSPGSLAANAASTEVFARGLSDDATFIASNARPGDLAVGYHLSGPYLRDRLSNFDDVAPGVSVIHEAREGSNVVTDLDRWVDADTTTIWCLIPFEAGPDATAASCRPRAPDWSPVAVTTGERATIVELQRAR